MEQMQRMESLQNKNPREGFEPGMEHPHPPLPSGGPEPQYLIRKGEGGLLSNLWYPHIFPAAALRAPSAPALPAVPRPLVPSAEHKLGTDAPFRSFFKHIFLH